ncbi:phosphoadenosine phosphosulfate sulfotransferase [Heyndrickxia ginsengihumi]|uniref:Phosphoadenosine phosphosulfate sulfotransferase n=1 Tax=Heyndrickxia ginsengihumi TaxID=363870 RepID=A0A0A6VDN3_9BACI|nr:hypothetical protein [Heyndrickxia ginsengihumi]KHD86360.1 phosphoadenosine phosphosulfate sulfotransferase [Heyndrickxia ginsengihumi]
MKIGEHISIADKRRLKAIAALNEKLSLHEWEEIMGKNRETYVKIRGKVRRK